MDTPQERTTVMLRMKEVLRTNSLCLAFGFTVLVFVTSFSGCSSHSAYWLDTTIPKMEYSDISPTQSKPRINIVVDHYYGKDIDEERTRATAWEVESILSQTRLFGAITTERDATGTDSLHFVFKSLKFCCGPDLEFTGTYAPVGKEPIRKEYSRDIKLTSVEKMPPDVATWADYHSGLHIGSVVMMAAMDSALNTVRPQIIPDFVLKFIADLQADGYLVD